MMSFLSSGALSRVFGDENSICGCESSSDFLRPLALLCVVCAGGFSEVLSFAFFFGASFLCSLAVSPLSTTASSVELAVVVFIILFLALVLSSGSVFVSLSDTACLSSTLYL